MNQPSVIGNLKTANQGVFFLLLVALPFDNALFHFSTLLLLTTFLLSLSYTGWEPFKRILAKTRNVQWAFLCIAGLMIFSNLWNQQNGEAWRAVAIFVARYWLLMIILLYFFESGLVSMRAFFSICIVAVAIQFVPFLMIIWDGTIFARRFEGFSSNANIIGLYAGLGALMAAYWLIAPSRLPAVSKVSSGFLLVIACLILLASGSRASWLATLVGFLLFAIFQFRHDYKTILPSLALIGGLSIWVFTNNSVPMSRLELLLHGDSSLRNEIWEISFGLFLDRPILGYGLDTKRVLLQHYHIYSEHNIFMSVLLGLGLVGLLAYFYLLVRICWSAWQNDNHAAFSFMCLLLTAGLFGFDFYRDQHFMVSFVLISAVCLSSSPSKLAADK